LSYDQPDGRARRSDDKISLSELQHLMLEEFGELYIGREISVFGTSSERRDTHCVVVKIACASGRKATFAVFEQMK